MSSNIWIDVPRHLITDIKIRQINRSKVEDIGDIEEIWLFASLASVVKKEPYVHR